MTKVINPNLKQDAEKLLDSKEVRSMAKYIRTHGEYRSGLDTTSDGPLVPTAIVQAAQDLGANKFRLKPYLNYIPITSKKSDYPVMNPLATAYSREELSKYENLDDGITVVPVTAKDFGGKITLSNELIDDSTAPLTPMLAKEMSTIATNTENKEIMDKLASLPATKVSSMDDVLNAINSVVDSRFVKNVFIGQQAYGKLRTMKDAQGRYLLDTSANTLCGVPVVVLPNSLGHSNDLYVGSLEDSLGFFDRGNVSLNYANNNLFAKSLAMVMRFDVEFTYKPAIARLTFDDKATAAK